MLDKKHRLSGKESFRAAEAFSFRGLLIKVKNNELNFPRFSAVISKKVDKRATERNRIRRMIGNFIRENLNNIENGRDVLIIARPSIKEKEREEVFKILKTSFMKANIIK